MPELNANPVAGENVRVSPFVAISPVRATSLALLRSVNVVGVAVSGSMGSLNVAVRAEDGATLVAPLVGVVALTVGRVVSGVVPVVKVQLRGAAIGVPVRSLMPVVKVAVYVVDPVSGAVRAKVAVLPVSETVPPTGGFKTNVERFTVDGITGSLKVAVSDEDVGTSMAPFAGVVAATVGALDPLVLFGVVPGVGPSQAGGIDPTRVSTRSKEEPRWGFLLLMWVLIADYGGGHGVYQ